MIPGLRAWYIRFRLDMIPSTCSASVCMVERSSPAASAASSYSAASVAS